MYTPCIRHVRHIAYWPFKALPFTQNVYRTWECALPGPIYIFTYIRVCVVCLLISSLVYIYIYITYSQFPFFFLFFAQAPPSHACMFHINHFLFSFLFFCAGPTEPRIFTIFGPRAGRSGFPAYMYTCTYACICTSPRIYTYVHVHVYVQVMHIQMYISTQAT